MTAIVLGFVTLYLSLAGIDLESLGEIVEEGPPDISVLGFILIAMALTIFGAIGYVLGTTILHIFSRAFGGKGSWSATLSGLTLFSVLGVFQLIPLALATIIATTGRDNSTSAFSGIASLIQLIVTIWTIVLIVILVRENYRVTTGAAALTVLLSVLVSLFVVGLIIALLILILVFVLFAILGLTLAT